MIDVIINGKTIRVGEDTDILTALADLGYEDRRVAVALNGTFIPRSAYQNTFIHAADQMDVLSPIAGG